MSRQQKVSFCRRLLKLRTKRQRANKYNENFQDMSKRNKHNLDQVWD